MSFFFFTSLIIRMILNALITVAAVEKLELPTFAIIKISPKSVAATTKASNLFQASSKYYETPSPRSFMIISALKINANT